MANVINIQTLDELRRFLNDKGIMEIALRGKNKKFKTFQKIALDPALAFLAAWAGVSHKSHTRCR